MQFFILESDQGTMIFTMTSTTLENLFGQGIKKSGPIFPSGRMTLLLTAMLMLLHTQNENFSNNHPKDPTGPNQNIEKQKS